MKLNDEIMAKIKDFNYDVFWTNQKKRKEFNLKDLNLKEQSDVGACVFNENDIDVFSWDAKRILDFLLWRKQERDERSRILGDENWITFKELEPDIFLLALLLSKESEKIEKV